MRKISKYVHPPVVTQIARSVMLLIFKPKISIKTGTLFAVMQPKTYAQGAGFCIIRPFQGGLDLDGPSQPVSV